MLTEQELDKIADRLVERMKSRFVTHDEQKTKFELCFAFDCTEPESRDIMRGDSVFLRRLHDRAQRAGERVIMWLVALFGLGVISFVFGPDVVEKISGR